MWQHHFEFLLLGYGAYLTFSEFCKAQLPDIPDQHIAQMVAGHRRAAVQAERRARAASRGSRSTPASTARSSRAARPAEIDAELGESEAGRAWLDELEQIKDPWFNMAIGDGLYHFYGSWYDDPSIPYASVVGHIRALQGGRARSSGRPRRSRRERDRLAEEYGALLDEEARGDVRRAARALAHGLPVRRGAQVLLRLLVPDPLVEQAARVRRRCSPTTASSRTARTCSSSDAPRGRGGARRAAAHVGDRRRCRSGRATGRRSSPAARSCSSGSPSGRRRPRSASTPEAITDPMSIMLWGVTTQRVQEWASARGRRLAAARARPRRRASSRGPRGS